MPKVSHAFVSAIADGGDTTLVGPTTWNASHVILGLTYKSTKILTSLASATYTAPASLGGLFIQMWGPGGGGAGASSSALSAAAGSSGGGGGYMNIFIGTSSVTSAYDYKCGTGGTGGAAGSNPGVAGTTTWMRDAGGVTFSAFGGVGGVAMTVNTTAASSAGGVGGSTSNGSFSVTGETGGNGIRFSGTVALTKQGGGAAYAPGEPGEGGPTVGATAAGYAFGGGGACVVSSSNARGGDGGPGLIWIDEYY